MSVVVVKVQKGEQKVILVTILFLEFILINSINRLNPNTVYNFRLVFKLD